MTSIATTEPDQGLQPHVGLRALMLGAIGVVFGDIGTSPLYTLKTALEWGGGVTPAAALGILSLIVWTLLITTSIKYVAVVMRVDNDGEGGILALMSLLGIKRRQHIGVIAIGLFGAALLYGDGAITPAISVLSALEGLKLPLPNIAPYVLPLSVAVLIGVFALQSQGTARIGRLFGPIMIAWFIAIGVLGLSGVLRHPGVLTALDPRYGLDYLLSHGFTGFLVLGAVFLCATGAEALYADMGHFGPLPIRLAWYGLVLPTLLLNYAGQAALVVEGAVPSGDNPFFVLCPALLQLPLVVLSTVATIIASQAIITGAFSMTRQAIQLGWCPRMHITQTSAQGYGQIYVGFVNWSLMALTLALTIGFGSSDNLAAAFGIAVSLTMLLTTVLLFLAMREVWHWSLPLALLVAGLFALVDLSFVGANLMKVFEGGWVPLCAAGLIYGLMMIWHRGTIAVVDRLGDLVEPTEQFMARLAADGVPRVPGTAVFLTKTNEMTPPIVVWHVRHNRALHRHILVLTVRFESVPWIDESERLRRELVAENFWRLTPRYGFMERPDIPQLLAQALSGGCHFDPDDVTYYVGHETVLHRIDGSGLPEWQEAIFAAMERNSSHVSDYFNLPRDRVVEIGRQVEI
jgi:KUP system potassium uptake protein